MENEDLNTEPQKTAEPKPAAKKSTDKPKAAIAEGESATAAKADANPQAIEIWPLRSYHDAGEFKRRGGPSYNAPKRHADALISNGLATKEKPKG